MRCCADGLTGAQRRQAGPRFAWQDADRGGTRNHTRGQANPLEVAPRKGFPPCRNRDLSAAQFPPASPVLSDGLHCFTGVGDAGSVHQPIITGSGRKAALNPAFKWVNTTPSATSRAPSLALTAPSA